MDSTLELGGPRTDHPAHEDHYTQAAVAQVRWSTRILTGVASAMLAASVVVAALVPSLRISGGIILGVGMLTALVALRAARWTRTVCRLLRGGTWRPVALAVGSHAGYRVRIAGADGTITDFKAEMCPAHALLLARTRRAWLLGPDASGRAALRPPGLHAPLLLRRTPAGRRVEMLSALGAPQSADLASDDAVAASFARTIRRGVLLPPLALLCLLLVVVAIPVVRADIDVVAMQTLIIAALVAVVLLILGASWWLHYRDLVALPKLLAAGPWQRVPARLTQEFQPSRRGPTTVKLAVRFGGEELTFVVNWVSADTVAYIEDTGTIWFAGSPRTANGPVAIGVSDYPILQVARPSRE